MIPIRTILAAGAGRTLLPAPAVLVLALVLAACGSSAGTSASPVPTNSVNLPPSYRFDPPAITVPAGTTVTWTNNDNFTHNVRLDGAEPRTMTPGESVTETFATPGTFPYVCSLHPGDMTGTVVVTG